MIVFEILITVGIFMFCNKHFVKLPMNLDCRLGGGGIAADPTLIIHSDLSLSTFKIINIIYINQFIHILSRLQSPPSSLQCNIEARQIPPAGLGAPRFECSIASKYPIF